MSVSKFSVLGSTISVLSRNDTGKSTVKDRNPKVIPMNLEFLAWFRVTFFVMTNDIANSPFFRPNCGRSHLAVLFRWV